MSGLLFALLAAFLGGFGGKDQCLVAQLRRAHGASVPLIVVAAISAALAASLAVWFGTFLEIGMSEDASTMFVAFALLFAAIELALPARRKAPAEPTRSAGATFLALLSLQATDAARFLLVALTLVMPDPLIIALGGAIGGVSSALLGWAAPDLVLDGGWQVGARRLLAALVFAAALTLGLTARGMIG